MRNISNSKQHKRVTSQIPKTIYWSGNQKSQLYIPTKVENVTILCIYLFFFRPIKSLGLQSYLISDRGQTQPEFPKNLQQT